MGVQRLDNGNTLIASYTGLVVEVAPAQALGWKKCERCWTWSPRVGEDAEHPALCERCAPVVRALRP